MRGTAQEMGAQGSGFWARMGVTGAAACENAEFEIPEPVRPSNSASFQKSGASGTV